VPYADWAGLLGLGGRRISGKDEVPGLWEEALAADRPFVVDAVVDANVPLIPPHLTLQQVVNTAKSQLKGDPAAPLVIADGLREAVGAPARGLWHRAVDALTGG
jgi:pyruvate dehydrogenase (quinone)